MKILKELKLMVKTKFLLTFLALAASSGASYAAGSKKMFSLDNTDFVVLISFLIFVGILIYFKVPSIIASFLDNRSNEIQNEIEKASEVLEEAKKILSSIESDHIRTSETIKQMVVNAKNRAGEDEDKAKKHIEELMKNKLTSAKGQIKSNERKILEEIEERAIDLSIEKVRAYLSKSLSDNSYDKHFEDSFQSIEKGLKEVYS
jgi:F-type H+-transporting ATPase subunit b